MGKGSVNFDVLLANVDKSNSFTFGYIILSLCVR